MIDRVHLPQFQKMNFVWRVYIEAQCTPKPPGSGNTTVDVTTHVLFAKLRDEAVRLSGLTLNSVRGVLLPETNSVGSHRHTSPVFMYFPQTHPIPLTLDSPSEDIPVEEGYGVLIPGNRMHSVRPPLPGQGTRYTIAVILNP